MRETYEAPFLLNTMKDPHIPAAIFRVSEDYSIQEAMEKCLQAGGGTVVVGKGEWHTGPLHIGSCTHLQFEEGAVVIFSDEPEDYLPVVFTRWEGMECYNYSPLIYANNCHDIAITGKGKLIGSGERWWPWKKLQQEAANELCYAESEGIPVEKRIYGTKQAALRPSFVQLISCRDILIEDITLIDGPQWTIHPVYCENVQIRRVHIDTKGPNTDGLNPDSCKNVLIEDSDFETGDDCIAINAGMNEDGWRVGRPCENILIRHCRMTGGHGAIVIGSAVSGNVKNVYAHDCTIFNVMTGIRIKSMRGRGGEVSDVTFENMEITNTSVQAIQINMFYESSTVIPKSDTPSRFHDITIRNIHGKNHDTAILLRGLPEMKLEKITMEDITLEAKQTLICEDVSGLNLKNVELGG